MSVTQSSALDLIARGAVEILKRDDFAKRHAQQPIAIHEFLYPLVQCNDPVWLSADDELGENDQTFFIGLRASF